MNQLFHAVRLLTLGFLPVIIPALQAQDEAGYFAAKARDMAAMPYVDGTIPETEYAKSLSYDHLNHIHLKPGREIFAQGPGLVRIVPHPGAV